MNTQSEVSRHKCLIYDGEPSEQLPVVVPLLMDGLRDNWRCLYLGSPDAVRMIDAALGHRGIDTRREQDRSALVLSSDRSHLVDGRFDPDAMIDGLASSVDDAVAAGFRGLCATGDMRWELGADENFDRLLEYEALLERLFRDKPLTGICQYHRRMLPAEALHDALLTHRSAYVGDVLNKDNLYYIPPELLLEWREGGHGAGRAEWMSRQILRVLEAERSRDEVLRDLEQRVAERTAELEVANRHLRAFSYSVSHDLKAPLRAISGFGAALAEDCAGQLDETGSQHLGRMLSAARRMGELIDGMLVLGKAVESELRRVPVDLGALAQEVADALREAEPDRSAEVVIASGLHAVGDPVLLRAVMTNLLGNAWKFTAGRVDARIEVGCNDAAEGGRVFFVRDNGVGFDMQYSDKLFAEFQRLHSHDEFEGTGVGLATVERIVSRHGGRIWAEGTPGAGATFHFTLADPALAPVPGDAPIH
jgi:signal transduction histidine kinase